MKEASLTERKATNIGSRRETGKNFEDINQS